MKYSYSKVKDLKLRVQRGISFEEIIHCINQGFLLKIIPHLNRTKYPTQYIMLVNIQKYVWLVPCERKEEGWHLITAYKSRKYTKIYFEEENE